MNRSAATPSRLILLLLPVGALLAAQPRPIEAGATPSLSPDELERQIAEKRDDLLGVVRELRSREFPGASAELHERRALTLNRLERYALSERFTINDQFPFDMPFFVDSRGTRCAVAHLIEESGRADLLLDLSNRQNNAHIGELLDHEQLLRWAQRAGLTVQEIAYIQGPGNVVVRSARAATPRSRPRNKPHADLPILPPGSGPQPASIPVGPNVTGGRPQPPVGATTTVRRARRGSVGFQWSDWWNLHRGDYANIRERYHDGGTSTGRQSAGVRRFAPDAETVRERVVPTLRDLLDESSAISTTAALGLAHAARVGDPAEALKDLHGLIRSVRGPDQVFAVLSLGLLPDGIGVTSLTQIAQDTGAGRKLLGRGSSASERTRSFAALGLGFAGAKQAIPALEELVEDSRDVELRRSAVMALGLVSANATNERAVTRFLLDQFREDSTDSRLAMVLPLALAASGSTTALGSLFEVVRNFRGPDEVRMSCAIALGRMGDPLEPEVTSALIDIVRRDTHTQARQAAIVALAEMARRTAGRPVGEARKKALEELSSFFLHGLRGEYRQPLDIPWHALASGLMIRSHDWTREVLEYDLRTLLRTGTRDERAAATVALSLAGGRGARDDLLASLENADPLIAGYAAEGLGILDDPRARAPLSEMLTGDSSDFVRYHAARGLALLADPDLLTTLHDAVAQTSSDSVRASLMQAIGEIGDQRSISMLTQAAQDEKADDMSRARAVGALTKILRQGDEPWVLPLHRMTHSAVVDGAVRELMALR